tara:strand:- start:10383 stop:10745 length:363 start_codon:yes stop_codon:yes gene_type:complete
MTNEKNINAFNGYTMLLSVFLMAALGGFLLIARINPILPILMLFASLVMLKGFVHINPNSSRVLLLFGKYMGTIKKNGLFWVNPLYSRKVISLRASNFDSERLKVNDKLGNPVMISTILV